jgi:hypothetical protein
MKLELAWNGVLELGVFKSFLGSCAMGYNFCRGILGETYGSVRTKIVGRGKHTASRATVDVLARRQHLSCRNIAAPYCPHPVPSSFSPLSSVRPFGPKAHMW